MNITRRQFTQASAAFAVDSSVFHRTRGSKLKVLIVDGINNHDWRTATAGIRKILEDTRLFSITVSTTPPRDAFPEQWNSWRPAFAQHDAVINNFNGGEKADGVQWPKEVRKSFEAYLEGGGGLIVFHAANNSFLSWPAYNEMIGLGWRENTFGRGIRITDNDTVIYIPQGQGPGPGHPEILNFQVHVRNIQHPIIKDMPKVWMHPSDQLTHGQHGGAEDLTILTYANSPVTHANEPMDWVRFYGNGRVYTTLLGHTWAGEPTPDLDCIGFQTLFARGVQWAASGKVTIPIPANFPRPDRVSLSPLHL